jgi:UDP-glucuronate decarboxylase
LCHAFHSQEFAELIKEITASNSTVKMLPATKDDPRQRKPDITLAGEQLGWKPVVSACPCLFLHAICQ